MAEQFKPVVTDSASFQIAERLRTSILEGQLKVNDRLPTEEELAAQFGVSRPTIREALKRLAAQHLVRSRRGPTGGTFISRPTADQLSQNLTLASTLMVLLGEFQSDDILEAREQLEIVCGRLAVKRRTTAEIAELEREISFQRRQDITDIEFCASDIRFHRTLVEASQNSTLRFLMYAVIEALQPVENMIIFKFRQRNKIIAHHVAIAEGVRDGDAAKVENAIKAQIKYIRSQVSAAQSWSRKRGTTVKPDADQSAAVPVEKRRSVSVRKPS